MVLKNGQWVLSLDAAEGFQSPSFNNAAVLIVDSFAGWGGSLPAAHNASDAHSASNAGVTTSLARVTLAAAPAPSLVVTAGSGLKINLIWDSSVASAPAAFMTAIQTAAQMIEQYVINPITLNIAVGWGEIGGSPVPASTSEGGTAGDQYLTYAQVVQSLTKSAVSADDAAVLKYLPASNPYGTTTFDVAGGQLKALGLVSGTSTALDGEVGFATNWPSGSLVAAALHEITHAMGRNSGWGAPPTLLDLQRYNAPGVLADNGAGVSSGALQYFSLDGGKTVLANYANSSDYGDWASNSLTVNDPNNAFLSSNSNALTAVDVRQLDAMGYTIAGTAGTQVVTGALVSAAAALQANIQVVSFSIKDSAANVISGLGGLVSDSKLTSISFTDAGKPTISLTSAAYSADAAVVAEITSPYSLTVTGATVAAAAGLQTDSHVSAFTIADSAANVQAGFGALLADSNLTGITLTDTTTPSFTLSVAALGADSPVLAKIAGAKTVIVTNAAVADAAGLQANGLVTRFTVSDSAANILPALTALAADSKLTSIVAGGALAANAAALQAAAQVTGFAITDTAASVVAGLPALVADSKISTITLTDSAKPTITLSAAAYAADAAVLAKIVSPYTLVVTGSPVTTVAGAAAQQASAAVTNFTISDTAANVQAGLAALLPDTKLTSITLTNAGTATLAISAGAYNADSTVLAKITSPYRLTVSGATVAQAGTLQADARVTGFGIADTVSHTNGAVAALNADGKLTGLAVIGTTSGETLSLTGLHVPATIDMGGDGQSFAFLLSGSAMSFQNPPDVVALGSGAAAINFTIASASGLEQISNFKFGIDQLNLHLNGHAASSFVTRDVTVGGVHAVLLTCSSELYSGGYVDDGVVLTGVSGSMTAAALLSGHTVFSGGHALIG